LTDVDSLGERARALKGGRTGLLRVGAPTQAVETLLAGFVPRYRRRHPGVEVHLVEDGGVRMPERLEHGDVHLAIMPAGDARFRWRLLAPIYVLAVVSKSHPRARRATLEIEDLADTPLLLLRRDFGSRGWFEAACHIAHVRPRVLLESGAPATLVALAQVGYGIAIVPSSVRLPRGVVRTMPIFRHGQPLGQWASVSWDPRRFLAPYAEQFVDELVAYVRRRPWPRLARRVPPLPRPKEPAAG
jgi:DNA-binding transcriptional LysR family regulator